MTVERTIRPKNVMLSESYNVCAIMSSVSPDSIIKGTKDFVLLHSVLPHLSQEIIRQDAPTTQGVPVKPPSLAPLASVNASQDEWQLRLNLSVEKKGLRTAPNSFQLRMSGKNSRNYIKSPSPASSIS